MGLFRSSDKGKKHQTSPQYQPQQPQRYPQSEPQLYPIVQQPENWVYIEQRPHLGNGYGGPPQTWLMAPMVSPPQYQVYQTQSAPNISPPTQLLKSKKSQGVMRKMQSVSNLLAGDVPSYIPGASIFNDSPLTQQGTQYLCQGAALYDLISSKFNAVVTSIDGEKFSGDERELVVYQPPQPLWQQEQQPGTASREGAQKSKGIVNNSLSSAITSANYFAKVNLYANSRLPPDLPRMKLYIPTFPLLCLAAEYSERAYAKPSGQERETHIDADWHSGRKAMVIKSMPMDDMHLIVFAIRGSQSFMDWAVNFDTRPAQPEGFLDDPGNLCHAGFLTVARSMIKPVAARLRHLLEENPRRSKFSLLITGHSAGGAVAALLYSHMQSITSEASSELRDLAEDFKRIHCVTFGAPPVSLLPLTRSDRPALQNSIFFSFVNEGDPVARADKAYVRSLLDLYSHPAPGQSCLESVTPQKLQPFVPGQKSSSSLTVNKIRPSTKHSKSAPIPMAAPYWPVPEATLSNAGRVVLLRSVERYETRPNKKKQVQERMDEGVVAQMISDELLRDVGVGVGVIWGDPVCHMMALYARRIEVLATNAVMGRS